VTAPLKAPYPWPGGKSDIAAAVWARLGDTPNYVEPFAGSAALTLARPHDTGGKTETINDADAFITNALRAIEADPDQTAYWCDRPVNEVDLTASHLWLKAQRAELTARCFADIHYYDAEIAGRWLWGIASWIGDGWCVADGPWISVEGMLRDRRTLPEEERVGGIQKRIPEVGADGDGYENIRGVLKYRNAPGVPRKMPEVGTGPNSQIGGHAKGVQAYRPQGVPKKMPEVGAKSIGGDNSHTYRGVMRYRAAPAALLAYFDRLAARLRRVRILCGDWRRVVKPSITTNHGLTAVFLDPPYPSAEHDMEYHGDNDCWHVAAQWAVENGGDPLLRIAICGYFSEATDALFPPAWERYRWEARGGYSNQSKDGRGRANAKREVVWFSPGCVDMKTDYGPLFKESF
jgi:DNA adenine methylase